MKLALFIFLISVMSALKAQKILEIDITRFNRLKVIQLHNTSLLEYKLKGEHTYRINKMVEMRDSMIIFDNDSSIALSEIKAIKVRSSGSGFQLFSSLFLIGGSGFIIIDTFNNLINSEPKIVDERVLIIGASLITVGLLIKQLSIKRVRISKRKTLRILDTNYENLNN